VAILSGVVIAVSLVLISLGRWERNRAARSQNAQMMAVYRAVGSSLSGLEITGYRYGPPNCLAYVVGSTTDALQLCFDNRGRLVETVDRRHGKPRYASLTWQPALATFRLPASAISGVLKRVAAPPKKVPVAR
jgi:hypothetical protein